MPKIVIPTRASLFSTFGATLLDARHDFDEALYTELESVNIQDVEAAFERMVKSGI